MLFLDSFSLHEISKVKGSELDFVTGKRLSAVPGRVVSSVGSAVVRTSSGDLLVYAKPFVSSFEGSETEYDALSAQFETEANVDWPRTRDVDFTFSGERITDVTIVRDTVTKESYLDDSWAFQTDFGVILKLTSGVVGIFKASYFLSEIVRLEFAESQTHFTDTNRSIEWTDSAVLGESFSFTREFIPIEDLLKSDLD
jgi:hypothetical protein